MNSTLIFTAGAKGGTGKSTAVRFLITYLREKGCAPLLIDMDNESQTLSRFFPEARKINIKDPENPFSQDILVEAITDEGSNLVVADLKGGVGEDTLEWWNRLPFDELQTVNFICLAAVTSSPDSVRSFLAWADSLKGRVSYIVCKNEKDGASFPDYDNDLEVFNVREYYEPHHVKIEHLNEVYMTELERFSLTIAEVIAANGKNTYNGKEISPMLTKLLKRAHLRAFQNKIYDQFDTIPALQSIIENQKNTHKAQEE